MSAETLRAKIREIPDFPKPGILFYDITTLLKDADAYREAGKLMLDPYRDTKIDIVVGMESRGFIFSSPMAYELGTGLAPGRHTLTLRVDNRVIVNVGAWAHSVTDHTQGNWNGLIGAMETAGIEGQSFNLIGAPCLSAQEYLDELDRAGGMRIQRHATPIFKFYLRDMVKWVVKVAVRHPERRLPSYRDWESRTQRAVFDCTAAKTTLGWQPVSDRTELVRQGIEVPLLETMR